MTVVKFKNFIHLTEEEKLLVLEWRNSDRIRTKMQNQEIISKESHFKFVDSLKNRTDCKYYLFLVDDVPIGVFDEVNINPQTNCGTIGAYIGDTNYLGYGLLLNFLIIETGVILNAQSLHEKPTKEQAIYVMKNNPRVYKMHKNIFGAKDLCEEDDRWYIYWNKEDYDKIRGELAEMIYTPLNIEKVVWEG